MTGYTGEAWLYKPVSRPPCHVSVSRWLAILVKLWSLGFSSPVAVVSVSRWLAILVKLYHDHGRAALVLFQFLGDWLYWWSESGLPAYPRWDLFQFLGDWLYWWSFEMATITSALDAFQFLGDWLYWWSLTEGVAAPFPNSVSVSRWLAILVKLRGRHADRIFERVSVSRWLAILVKLLNPETKPRATPRFSF